MRVATLSLGFLSLCLAWSGVLPAYLPGSFTVHMTMHMLVVAVAAPLLSLALAGSRVDPVRRASVLFAPIPASVVELFAVWVWHAPALHHAARTHAAALVVEQGSFLLCGLLLWLAALGGDRARAANRRASGIVALLLTSMHMTLLGALLALAPRPLYAHADVVIASDAAAAVLAGAASTTHGLTPLQDQHLGGAIMLLAGGLCYLAGGLWLTLLLLRERGPSSRDESRRC